MIKTDYCSSGPMLSSHFFYTGTALVVLMNASQSDRFFRSGSLLLAEQHAQAVAVLLSDEKGSTLAALHTGFDTHRAYSVYGHTPAPFADRSAFFNGERLDGVLGCYLPGNAHRIHSPALMRFCSPDTLSPFQAGGLNAYVYCSADPVNRIDPSGRFSFRFFSRARSREFAGEGRQLASGIYAFLARHPQKNKNAITVLGHGDPIAGKGLGAEKVVDMLNQAGFNTSKYDTHFITCHSADPTLKNGDSFIQAVSNLTQRSSTGYRSEVTVHADIHKRSRGRFTKGRDTDIHVRVFKTRPSGATEEAFSYEPVTVSAIRNTRGD
ncbi:RHS repeat-associated core domain-containing protein [Pseudomonas monteilii]